MLSPRFASSVSQPKDDSDSALCVTITSCDRWQIYHRLQALEISCECGGFEPLRVQVATPTEALQLRSILRRVSQPRLALAADLQRCWQASV